MADMAGEDGEGEYLMADVTGKKFRWLLDP